MVKINVNKLLKNTVSMLKGSKNQIFRVKYERLPDWCAICGHLNHMLKEHGYGVHPPKALFFKNLHATWFMKAGSGPGNGRGRRIGRGRGSMSRRGRGGASDFESEDLTWTWMMSICRERERPI